MPPESANAEGAVTVEGAVDRIVYADEATAWAVVRLTRPAGGEFTAVGSLLGVRPGEQLRLSGEWVDDAKYGRQFRAGSFLSVQPSTLAGIERYLGSGLVAGVGKVMAKRLVARFGIETLEVIDRQPERLGEVEGIGPVRRKRITEAWAEQRGMRELVVLLQSHGIAARHAARIYRHFGPGALAAVRRNPYRLATEVFGIGFRTADSIAGSLGMAPDAPQRVAAGVLYTLERAGDEGHVFLPREKLVAQAAELLATSPELVERAVDGLVERGEVTRRPAPDGEALARPELDAAEETIAERVTALLARPAAALDVDADRALAWFEERQGLQLAAAQSEAVRRALTHKLLILTGGPGTGKTTLVRALVEIFTRKGRRVQLAAPTGRAANRLAESTGMPARTVHRMLEFDPRSMTFGRRRDFPVDADLVVVDETSMLDCRLASHLFAALPDAARLLLVGDVDQLPSVGPGRVLADLIESGLVPVVRLTEIFRQAERSWIVTNAHRIRAGELPWTDPDAGAADFHFFERREPEEVLRTVKHLVTERIPAGFGLRPLDDIQVLAPMRRGIAGVENLNRELQQLLNPDGAPLAAGRGRLRLGDRVMQLRNNYALEVFNGDVGRIVGEDEEAGTVRVSFEGRAVDYDDSDVDQLALAYACSVHKAQGSEYPCVVMPLHSQHYMMLQRHLLYTAVTRGRRLVVLVGERRALAQAVRNDRQQVRYTLLAARLQRLSSSSGVPGSGDSSGQPSGASP